MKIPCKNIPTYNADLKTWTKTSFKSQLEFAEFLLSCFKEPGEYGFDESTKSWNIASKKFITDSLYTDYAPTTPEYNNYWDNEKLKSRLGIIWKSKDKTWYLTRDYYFLLNYCPVRENKENSDGISFMNIRDVQYHMMLYEKIAEAYHKHSAILKKRQMGFSVCHTAKCVNFLWFENRKTIKILASLEKYLNTTNGNWKMIDFYMNHLNTHTDWQRIFMPGKYPELKQVEEIQNNATKQWIRIGNESTLSAITVGTNVTNSVGGAGFFYWWEEGGVAPKADEALMYIDPALEVKSDEKSGSFCIGGSVGDLDQCKPLELFMEDPKIWNFFPVKSKWIDDTGIEKESGLFIPTQYGMPEAVDEFGNTLVEKALEVLKKQEIEWKKLPADKYAIKKSQNPKTMKEAFAWRKLSEFDVAAIERQQEILKIKDKENAWEIKPIKCKLYKDKDGKTQYTTKDLSFEIEYPVIPTMLDKRGVVTLYELPKKNAPFWTYFAGVDPVEVGNTTTSKSVFSISIWERAYEEEYLDEDSNVQIRITGDKMVANWRGRFDNPEKTNEYAQMLIQMYNAYTLAERNKPNFINFFERKLLTHLLAKEKEIDIFKDFTNSNRDNSQYGFFKGSNGKAAEVFKHFKQLFKEYLNAEYGTVTITNKDGEVNIKTIKGLERIPDYWFLEELKLYNDDNIENFDRIISDFAGYYIMKLYSIKNGIHRIKLKKENTNTNRNIDSGFYNYLNNTKASSNKSESSNFDFTDY